MLQILPCVSIEQVSTSFDLTLRIVRSAYLMSKRIRRNEKKEYDEKKEIEIGDETSWWIFKRFCEYSLPLLRKQHQNGNGLLQFKKSAKNDAYSTAFRLKIPPVTLYYRYLIIHYDFLIPCFLHFQRCTIRLLYDGSSIKLASWLAMVVNRLSNITMVFRGALFTHFPRRSNSR